MIHSVPAFRGLISLLAIFAAPAAGLAQYLAINVNPHAGPYSSNISYGVVASYSGPNCHSNPTQPQVTLRKSGSVVAVGSWSTSYTSPGDTGPATIQYKATCSCYGLYKTRSVTINGNTPPIGVFDSITPSVEWGQSLSATGWAADDEMGAPVTRVYVRIDVGTNFDATLNGDRPDVATAYGRSDYRYSGWSYGYNTSSLAVGSHTAYAYAVDDQSQSKYLGSKPFVVVKANQTGVGGSLSSSSTTYPATRSVTASGGQSSGAYEFRQYGGSGAVTFSGSGSSRTITPTVAGTAVIQVRKLGNSNYNTSGWVSVGTLTISKANQSTLTISAVSSQTYNTSQTVGSSGGSGGGAVSYAIVAQSASGAATLSGATLTANTGTGWADVRATKAADSNYNAKTSATVRVNFQKAGQATLNLSRSTPQTYNTSQTVGSSGGSGGGAVSYAIVAQSASGAATLSGATLTANTGAGWVDVRATKAADSNYNAKTSATVRVNFQKAGQATLNLSRSTPQTYNMSQTVGSSGGSGGGAVSYAIVAQSASGAATLSGATLTANTGTGWVDVRATKAADSNYNAKTSATVRVNFQKAGQATLNLSRSTPQTYNTSQTVGSSGGSGGGAVSYAIVAQSASGAATLSGATLTANTGTGWADVRATKAADSNYNAKTSATVRVNFQKAGQATLNLSRSTPQTYNTSQTVGSSGGSGGGAVSYAIVTQSASGAATLSGATLTANTGTGWADVRATKAADSNYNAKTSATVRVNFQKAGQATLNLSRTTPQTYNTSQTVGSSGGSGGGAVSYAIVTQSASGAATLSGATLTANTGTGWADVRATKAADSNYNSTNSATVRVNFQKANQSALTISATSPQSYSSSQTLSATGGTTGGALSYAIVGQSTAGVATLAGASLTANSGTGWADLRATRAGNTNYNAVQSTSVRVNLQKSAQTISFPAIGHQFIGDPEVTLAAASSSGLTISYAVVSGSASISGNTLTLGSVPGDVTVRASQAGNGNYNAASTVDRTFRLWGLDEDPDGDGLGNGWERAYGLDPFNSSDAEQVSPSGLTYLEAYHLWRDPNSTAPNDESISPSTVDATVLAKGTGTVTISDGTESYTMRYEATSGGHWQAPVIDGNPYLTGFSLEMKRGERKTLTVTTSGVTNYSVKFSEDREIAPYLKRRILLNGGKDDVLTDSDIQENEFTVEIQTDGFIPFGQMDLSELETTRVVNFGMGASRSGVTPGRIVMGLGRWHYASGLTVSIVEGEALEGVVKSPTRYQAKASAGYVEVMRTRYVTTVSYYADDTPFDGTFHEFPESSRVATYAVTRAGTPTSPAPVPLGVQRDWDGKGAISFSITKTVGGVSSVLDFETFWFEALLDGWTQQEEPHVGTVTQWADHYATVSRFWTWRELGAPRDGLTRLDYYSYRTALRFGADNNPVGYTYQPRDLKVTRYLGSSDASQIGFREWSNTSFSDFWMVRAIPLVRGVGADEHALPRRMVRPQHLAGDGLTLRHPPTQKENGLGGASFTRYLSSASYPQSGNNFDGQPTIAFGEPKYTRQSFGDDPVLSSSDLITTYDYFPDPVDGRTVVKEAVTLQGAVEVGRKSFTYVTGTLDGVETVVTTETAHAKAGDALVTTSRSYGRGIDTLDLRSKPIYIIRPDGTKTSYCYERGTLAGAAWTAGESGLFLRTVKLEGKTGSTVADFEGAAINSLDMQVNRSIATERIIDNAGRLVRERSYLYTGPNSFEVVNSSYSTYNIFGDLLMRADQPITVGAGGALTTSGRVFYDAVYDGARKLRETDETGVTLHFEYDDYGRIEVVRRQGVGAAGDPYHVPELITTYEYDPLGRVKKETVSSTSEADQLVTEYTYDTAGRVKSVTKPGGLVTSIVYDSPTQTTTTLPGGGTSIKAVYKDGRDKSQSGTAAPEVSFTHAYNSSGFVQTTETLATGAWTRSTRDWTGRVMKIETPAWAGGTREVVNAYNNKGQLSARHVKKGAVKLSPSELFQYDDYGHVFYRGFDTNDNGVIDVSSDMGVTRPHLAFAKPAFDTANWYLYEVDLIFPYDADDEAGTTDRSGEYRQANPTYTQLSGFPTNTLARVYQLDFDGNYTDSVTTVDRANALVTTSTASSGTSALVEQTFSNGLLMDGSNAQGHTVVQQYDGLGRLAGVSDPRIGLTLVEYQANTLLPRKVTEPDDRTTQTTYDAAGNVATVTNHAGRVSRYKHDASGNLTHVWGDVPNPAKFGYNDLGQRTAMTTYRSGSWSGASLPSGFGSGGDLTTWSYDPATGLLNYKETADLHRVNYTYDDLGRVSKRTDARSWVTDYHYNGQSKAGTGDFNGLLRKIDYLDAYTADVEYTYHRTGKPKTVTDAAGTRSFNYYESWAGGGSSWSDLRNKSGRLQSETLPAYLGGHVMRYDYQFHVPGKWNGELGSVSIDGDATYKSAYQYDAVGRFANIGYKTQDPFHYAYEANSNLVDAVTRKATDVATAYTYQRDYGYEPDSDRLAGMTHRWAADGDKQSTATLGYNTLGLLQSEATLLGGDLRAAFGIDGTSSHGFHQERTYTARDEVDISARYQLDSSGAIGGILSGFSRSYDYDAIGNRTLDHLGSYTPNAVNQYTDTPHDNGQAITHDGNGNLTFDGKRSYSYDGENRVRQIVQGGVTYEYAYDYMGRRISKKTVGVTETRFLYDGWNMVAEMTASGAITRTFVWGTDVSGTLQGAGGVGGLLMIEDGSQQYFPVYDSGHNVTALYDQDGNVDAAYEYDAFGMVVDSGGSYAGQNPFGFSTKYTDAETGLVYYGLRYYNPESGRFVNRDPIEEAGGLNLYGFVGNNPVNHLDVLGMLSDQEWADLAGYDSVQEFYAAGWGSYSRQRQNQNLSDGFNFGWEQQIAGTFAHSAPSDNSAQLTGGDTSSGGLPEWIRKLFGFLRGGSTGSFGDIVVIDMGDHVLSGKIGQSRAEESIAASNGTAQRNRAARAVGAFYDPGLVEAYAWSAQLHAMSRQSGPKYTNRDSARAYVGGLGARRTQAYDHASRYGAIVGNGAMVVGGVVVASSGVGTPLGAAMIAKGTIDFHLNVGGLIDHYQTGGQRNIPSGLFNAVGSHWGESGSNWGAAADAVTSLGGAALPGKLSAVSHFSSVQSSFDAMVYSISAYQSSN